MSYILSDSPQKNPSVFRGHFAISGDGLLSEILGFICKRTETDILRYIRAEVVDRPKTQRVGLAQTDLKRP